MPGDGASGGQAVCRPRRVEHLKDVPRVHKHSSLGAKTSRDLFLYFSLQWYDSKFPLSCQDKISLLANIYFKKKHERISHSIIRKCSNQPIFTFKIKMRNLAEHKTVMGFRVLLFRFGGGYGCNIVRTIPDAVICRNYSQNAASYHLIWNWFISRLHFFIPLLYGLAYFLAFPRYSLPIALHDSIQYLVICVRYIFPCKINFSTILAILPFNHFRLFNCFGQSCHLLSAMAVPILFVPLVATAPEIILWYVVPPYPICQTEKQSV